LTNFRQEFAGMMCPLVRSTNINQSVMSHQLQMTTERSQIHYEINLMMI